jgi:hypothetical protein
MTGPRSAFALILAVVLCPPGSAQVFEGRLTAADISLVPQSALGVSGSRSAAGLPRMTEGLRATLIPSLFPTPMAAPQVALTPPEVPLLPQTPVAAEGPILTPVAPEAAPQTAAPAMKVSAVADAVAPGLNALRSPDVKGEDAASAAEQIMSPVLGKTQGAASLAVSEPAQEQAVPSKAAHAGLRGSPLLNRIGFSEGVPAQHQSLFQETLTRRKAGWTRQLAAMGVKLDGPLAPILTVRSSKDIAKGTKVEFTIDWNQGETHVGAFKAVVTLKNVDPDLRRLPAPEPAKERQIRIRFNKSALAPDIDSYLERKGLRLLSKSWDGDYTVATTGRDQADALARDISGTGIVLSATPVSFSVPESDQVQIVFKKDHEDGIGLLLRRMDLRVISIDREGLYTVGAQGLAAVETAGRLQGEAGVLYAKPVRFSPPASSQLIIQWNQTSEDAAADLLKRHGLMMVKVLNNGAYKVARVSDASLTKDMIAAISQEPIVKQALALGGLTEEQIRSGAKGAASYKGRPWSATEYNMAYGTTYWDLEERGATPEQLKLFEKLCDEAPVRGGGFNPWSGD